MENKLLGRKEEYLNVSDIVDFIECFKSTLKRNEHGYTHVGTYYNESFVVYKICFYPM